jgi:hypothetical protein
MFALREVDSDQLEQRLMATEGLDISFEIGAVYD